jgi:16S rRNA (uracil1498-N3)-methyltransferase
MHRFHLPSEQCRKSPLTLESREAFHAVQVLRLARSERVTVLDGAGLELLCEVEEASRQLVRLRELERRQALPPPWRITLLQAIPKARLLEDIIQKATELGVHRVVPLLAERVLARYDEESAQAKILRWRHTAIEAIKQCGNPWLPQVEEPLSPGAFLQRNEPFDLALIGSLQDAPRHLREHVQAYQQRHDRLPVSICVWIGPEGDFTPAELAQAKTGGALPISLGRLVLRCDTAALYCLSALNHELSAPRI